MIRPTISVVIPTLNEQDNLPHVLPRIPRAVDEVIIVDGLSTDRTVEVAKQLLPSVRIVTQEGRGKGAALRSGFAAATGDIIVTLDADGSTDPAEIPYFVHALMAGADFAKGSRFLHGAGTSDMPFHRRMGNRAFVGIVRRLYGGQYTDLCYGYNAFWRRVLPLLALDGDGFEIETMMNIRALRSGLRIVEVPSFEDRRVVGQGNLRTIPDGWRVLRTIWSERRRIADPMQPTETAEWSPMPLLEQAHELVGQMAVGSTGHEAGNGNRHSSASGNGHASASGNGHGQESNYAVFPIGGGTEQLAAIAESSAAGAYRRHALDGVPAGTWEGVADEYVSRLGQLIGSVDRAAIARVVEELRAARDRGSAIFIAGNGGSSAIGTHLVNDLGKATKVSGRPPMRVLGLSDNVSWLTALANDEGYDRVFAGQLENFARPGDVLIVISSSGNSPNIVRAVEAARGFGMRTIGLLGFDGGRALSLVDEALWVRTEKGAYGLVETAHAALADIVTTCLISDLPVTAPTA